MIYKKNIILCKYNELKKKMYRAISGTIAKMSKVAKNEPILTNYLNKLDEFIDYILNDCNNCISEVEISEIKEKSKLYVPYKDGDTKRDENIKLCNLINTNISSITKSKIKGEDSKILKISFVYRIIDLFIKKNLLSKKNNRFYILNSNKKLSWHNIKNLKSKDVKNLPDDIKSEIFTIFGRDYDILLYIKSLFWFFRKAVVDSIISDLINYRKLESRDEDIIAMSVGSTSLSSDYDISIDSSYDNSGYIIDRYGILIEKIFNDNSETLFDTNIYGVSFIKRKVSNIFNAKHQCKNDSNVFSYIIDKNIDTPQIIWAYIQTLLKLNIILNQDSQLYEFLYEKLKTEMEVNNYFISAESFVNKYESNIDNYKYVVNNINKYLKDENNIKIKDEGYLISNFISFANYNGSETYLTNGAFLDIVVNQQMCKNGNAIKLSKMAYITSFIENISYLMVHYHRNKYRDRCMKALLELKNFYTDENEINTISDINKLLNQIEEIQGECNRNILNCKSFKMMEMCIDCIIKISQLVGNGDKEETDLFDSIIFPIDDKKDIDELLEVMDEDRMSRSSRSRISTSRILNRTPSPTDELLEVEDEGDIGDTGRTSRTSRTPSRTVLSTNELLENDDDRGRTIRPNRVLLFN